jgi:hypothetical protein
MCRLKSIEVIYQIEFYTLKQKSECKCVDSTHKRMCNIIVLMPGNYIIVHCYRVISNRMLNAYIMPSIKLTSNKSYHPILLSF